MQYNLVYKIQQPSAFVFFSNLFFFPDIFEGHSLSSEIEMCFLRVSNDTLFSFIYIFRCERRWITNISITNTAVRSIEKIGEQYERCARYSARKNVDIVSIERYCDVNASVFQGRRTFTKNNFIFQHIRKIFHTISSGTEIALDMARIELQYCSDIARKLHKFWFWFLYRQFSVDNCWQWLMTFMDGLPKLSRTVKTSCFYWLLWPIITWLHFN